MLVLTADQVGSRSSRDLVDDAIARIRALPDFETAVAPERTVGDEFQLAVTTGRDALRVILLLTRDRRWSVGCGVGGIRLPLAPTARESTGAAFFAARAAVERAKRSATRFALAGDATREDVDDVEAIINLLLTVRSRRSPEGWELYDALADGSTQVKVAGLLGITPQAVSNRARSADLRVEAAAVPALERLLDVVGGDTAAAILDLSSADGEVTE